MAFICKTFNILKEDFAESCHVQLILINMILVTGVTGHLGNAIIRFLSGKIPEGEITGLARNNSGSEPLTSRGIQIRTGDYDDYQSLVSAFSGVDKLFFISGNDIVKRVQQHLNVIRAAKEARVRHIIYTSFQRRTDDGSSPVSALTKIHVDTENNLISSGMTYTILRHALYMEGMPAFIGENVLETGIIFLPAGKGRVSCATRTDMAESASNILSSSGHENRIYEIASETSYSFSEMAQFLSVLSGKKITYIDAEPDTFRKQLIKAGVPESSVDFTSGFCKAIKQGEFDIPDPMLENLLGRKPVHMKDFLRSYYL